MDSNVVIIGHVDHGKSTLIGRLLYDSESITEGRVQEIQKLAEEYKRRFEFAYFIDSFDDELKEERTIDTSQVMFKGTRVYTVTDVPGHKEFIKNMLTGASHADVAVLVVAAQEGIKEQTGRHAFLINMLGIKNLFVLINKMDTVDYKQAIFEQVKTDVEQLLSTVGFQNVSFIPGSAWEGDNIYKKSNRMPWYQGPTLIEALDKVELHKETKPLRFVVQDSYTLDNEKIIVGRVESGSLKKGDRVVFQPSGTAGTIQKIIFYPDEIEQAVTGDSIGIVTDCSPVRGDVCGPEDNPPHVSTQFLGEAVLLDENLKKGETIELRCGTKRARCVVKALHEKLNPETGEVIGKSPDHISEHEAATIVFTSEPIVVERFSDIPELGRFILVRGKNIAAGIVLDSVS